MNAHKLVQEDTMSTKSEENREELEYEEDKAIFHHERRKGLLAQAAKAVGASYDYEPSCGSTPLDVTAVHEDQQVRQDPKARQKYINSVQKQIDLTYDFDCRAECPKTPEEIQDIQNALQQTYGDFALYTNVPLEMPNTQDCYLDQWNCVQVQLNKIWANDKTKKMEPPQVFALGKWTVSFDNWVSAPQAYLTYVRR